MRMTMTSCVCVCVCVCTEVLECRLLMEFVLNKDGSGSVTLLLIESLSHL